MCAIECWPKDGPEGQKKCPLPKVLIKPEIVCYRCEFRNRHGKEIGNDKTNWCPECDTCTRIPTTDESLEMSKTLYISDRCIGYNGMSGVPELRFLPSQILEEDAEVMGRVDYMYEEKLKMFAKRHESERRNEKIVKEFQETKKKVDSELPDRIKELKDKEPVSRRRGRKEE
mgnify:FL=1